MRALSLLFISGFLSISSLATLQAQQLNSSDKMAVSTDQAVVPGTATGSNSSTSMVLIRYEVRYSPVQRYTYINWQTISEPNNHRFEIERSNNGQTFRKIGQLPGNPNSQSIQYYKFTDTAPLTGKSFYRLKQVNTDSTYTYSRILSATTRRISGQTVMVTLSPNPCVTGNCDVKISNATPGTTTTVELLDDNGRKILSRNLPATSTGMPLSHADIANRKGIYYLRIISGDEIAMQRIVFE